MKGDFSRLTFDPRKGFLRVLMQQGRVQLDADVNEQAAILLHYLQALAADLIGPHGGPRTPLTRLGTSGGFAIALVPGPEDKPIPDQYQLTPGRYYVDGLLVENDQPRHSESPGRFLPGRLAPDKRHVLYLDVWEREVTYIQDNSIREVALGGQDTSLRTWVVWRVRSTDKTPEGASIPEGITPENVQEWSWQTGNRGLLQARARRDGAKDDNPCVTSPEARYRGPENQLYRVEIHRGGPAGEATFKWSRDNGMVVFAIRRMQGDMAYLEHMGRDERTGLRSGDWVELIDDERDEGGEGILLQVGATDARETAVRLTAPQGAEIDLPEYDEEEAEAKHPYLRRWDHREGSASQGVPRLTAGAMVLREGLGDDAWMTLEDSIQIRLQPGAAYRAGDYWVIPARTATGDVEWPGLVEQPETREPHGVRHRFAPLAIVSVEGNGNLTPQDTRRLFDPAGNLAE